MDARGTDACEAAALWHERLDTEASQSLNAAFVQWRTCELEHEEAFTQIETAHDTVKRLAGAPDILALRHETLTRLVMTPRRESWRAMLAAGIAAIIIGSASLIAWRSDSGSTSAEAAVLEPSVYRTGVGERLTIALADGSSATLNTASQLRVRYTSAERRLVLESGQAFFEVAKGQKRPFIVVAGDRVVTAHGTEFDVRLDAESLEVALIEGAVSVAPGTGSRSTVVTRLKPNELLVASGATTSVRSIDDAVRLTSWRDGLILFEDDRLADAVAEMNRYSMRPIKLADTKVGDMRISGAFHTGGTDAFVEALELGFDVKVVEDGNERIVLASRR